MKCIRLFLFLLASIVLLFSGVTSAFSQISSREFLNLETLPDSVRISFFAYSHAPGLIRFYSLADWNRYEGETVIEEYGSVVIEEDEKIYPLMRKLQGKDTLQCEELLNKSGIGRVIDNLPDSSFYTLYDGQYKDKLRWNSLQRNLLTQAMRDPQMRGKCLERYLSRCSCEVELFLSGRELGKIELYGKDAPVDICLYGMDLMRLIVNEFVDSNPRDFHKLGWYDYPDHFTNLAEHFEIEEKFLLLDYGNTARGGKYTDNLNREYVASLRLREPFQKMDKVAYPNVRILYSATESDKGLQRVPNLHKKARKVVERVLNVPFFSKRVEQKGERLNVWFFNDRNVNDYLVSLVAERTAELGIGEKELQHSILVEFPSRKPDMYLMLPDNRIILLIEDGYRYNYGVLKEFVTLPDSIEIHWKSEGEVDIPNIQKSGFWSGWVDLFTYGHSEKPYTVLLPSEIEQVYAAISDKDVNQVDLEEFGLAPGWVRRNAGKIWEMCANYNQRDVYYKRFSMNREQEKFFRNSFSDPSNLKKYLLQILKGGPWDVYNAVNEFTAVVHWSGGEKDTLLSGRDFFAHNLYPYVQDVWKGAAETHMPQGTALYKRMLDLWLLEHNVQLHKLGREDIKGQIRELERDFKVVEAGQLMDFGMGGGVYVKNDVPAYYALLRTDDMPEYMEFKYIFEKQEGKFPKFENLRRDFRGIIDKLKGIPFIQKLLGEGYLKILVSYVNDSLMSDYQIERNEGHNSREIFEDNPSFKGALERGECIYVEAVKQWTDYREKPGDDTIARYLIHSFVVSPTDKILVSVFGNRFIYNTEYRYKNSSTWVVNSQGHTWMAPRYGNYNNSTLLDLEGNVVN